MTEPELSFLRIKNPVVFDGLEKGAKTLPVYENGNGKQYYGIVATENYNPAVEMMRFFTLSESINSIIFS
jgi:hypothetical protein